MLSPLQISVSSITNIDVANKEMNIFSFQLVQAFTVSMRVIIQKVLELAQSTRNALQCFIRKRATGLLSRAPGVDLAIQNLFRRFEIKFHYLYTLNAFNG